MNTDRMPKPDQSDIFCWSKSPKTPKVGVNEPVELHSLWALCYLYSSNFCYKLCSKSPKAYHRK